MNEELEALIQKIAGVQEEIFEYYEKIGEDPDGELIQNLERSQEILEEMK